MIKRTGKYLTVTDVKADVDKLRAEMEERFKALVGKQLHGSISGRHYVGVVVNDAHKHKGFIAEVSALVNGKQHFNEWMQLKVGFRDTHFSSGMEAMTFAFSTLPEAIRIKRYRAVRFRVVDRDHGLIAWQCGPIWLTPSKTYINLRRHR